jgi:outer membrane protein OmpA-like peptidoglycan-associated protein
MTTRRSELQRIFGLTMFLGGVAVALTGCGSDGRSPFGVFATEEYVRNYVREQNAPIEATVANVDGRVTQVDARVTQVAGQTTEARKVADDGVRKATAADTRLTQSLANRYKRTLVETVSLRYASNRYLLTSEHTESLARVIKVLEDNPTYTVDIIGYTDAAGSKKANNQLSWRREEVVRRHLSDQAPVIHRISFIGLGEEKADGPKTTDAADRQVTIAIYRPD